jgi:hypothetical protein
MSLQDKLNEKVIQAQNKAKAVIDQRVDNASIRQLCNAFLSRRMWLMVKAKGSNLHEELLSGMRQDYHNEKGENTTPQEWLAPYYAEPSFDKVLKAAEVTKAELEAWIK